MPFCSNYAKNYASTIRQGPFVVPIPSKSTESSSGPIFKDRIALSLDYSTSVSHEKDDAKDQSNEKQSMGENYLLVPNTNKVLRYA